MMKPPRKIRDHFLRDIINRINDLETSIRILANSPSYSHVDGAGFNGQSGRKKIFLDLLKKYNFSCLVETGTYLGDTAGYMSETSGLPVYSCELNKNLYSLAKMRLREFSSISLYNLDSREFLRNLSTRPEIVRQECFLYLDAHWGKDLPLREEIAIIATRWEKFVIMIDDFQVPDDDGYKHDRYGTLKYIDMSYLRSRYNLCAFFPSMPSKEEPAGATGCVILAKENEFASPLKEISSIIAYRF